MDKEYYKEYYLLERTHWYFLARTNIIKTLTKKYNPQSTSKTLKILNIGVATGGTSQFLSEFGTVTSVEYDKDCCVFLEEKVGIKAVNASILELPFQDGFFDLVCAFDVIEHVDDDDMAVKEMKRVLKKGGNIMVTVPAFMFLWSKHDEINHHFRRYRKPKLVKLFKRNGLKILFKSYYNFFLFFPIAFYRVFFSKIFRSKKGSGSDFKVANSSKILNAVLFGIFNFENYILSKMRLPVGVSIFLISKKTDGIV